MSSLPDLVAAPMQLCFGRKRLLLSPLTVRDLGIYERMGGQYNALLSGDNCKLLFWLSLRHEHPGISYKQAAKMLQNPAYLEHVATALVTLNESAFCKDEKPDGKKQAETEYAPIFKLFSRTYGWTVQEVESLTLAQVNVYLRDIEADGDDRMHFNSREEARRYVAERQEAKK